MIGCVLLALPLVGCAPSEGKPASTAVSPQATAPPVAPAPTPAPVVAPPPPQLTQEQQRTRRLIEQVEAAYARGDADYRKGLLGEAKTEFDRAVDLMLQSGIDIRTNAELQEEFDGILDRVNGLEMEALKQGNGFVPKEEPSPADVASDVITDVPPKADPNIVAKAKADLATTKSDLPLVVNDYVAAFINFFANTQRGHNTLLHSFQRGRPLQGDDSTCPCGRGRAAGSYLSRGCGVRLQSKGHRSEDQIGRPRWRHVAIHARSVLRTEARRLRG